VRRSPRKFTVCDTPLRVDSSDFFLFVCIVTQDVRLLRVSSEGHGFFLLFFPNDESLRRPPVFFSFFFYLPPPTFHQTGTIIRRPLLPPPPLCFRRWIKGHTRCAPVERLSFFPPPKPFPFRTSGDSRTRVVPSSMWRSGKEACGHSPAFSF